jgi:neurotransmitter:Na+ symporter, NSS family
MITTYGSYAAGGVDLRQVTVVTIVGDTVVSLLAGLAVFPIVFAEKLDPASGPGLMFVTLPLAFARLPFGALAALAFFALLVIAALASAVSLLELPTAFLQTRLSWPRPLATAVAAGTCAALGLVSILSFNRWADWHPLGAIGFEKATAFDLMDGLTSNVSLPLAGFGLAVFGGWVMIPGLIASELHLGRLGMAIMRGLLRFIIPVAVAATALVLVRF